MARRIAFTGKQQVQLENFELPALEADQIQLRTLYTLISTGTETIVLNRNFDPGTHWDNWVKYPFYAGYLNVGEVEKVGDKVMDWKVGERVYTRGRHASHQIINPSTNAWHLPAGIDPKLATWFGLAKIAAMGARVAEYRLGDSVAVIGAGPIGQMTVRWAAAAGVENLIVIDTLSKRLEMTTKGGATHVICKPVDAAVEDVKAANYGELPRLVVDTTGHPAVFAPALSLAAKFGRVVLLGDTGKPAEQHLTFDVVSRGITIVGAHDTHEDATFNSTYLFRLFCRLVSSGRFNLEGLNTNTFTPDQFAKAYETANSRRSDAMGILFDWTKG